MPPRPIVDRLDDGLKLIARLGQLVARLGGHRRFDLLVHDSETFEMLESMRQRRRVHAANVAAESVEAERAGEERADDVEHPLLLQQVDRCVNRAEWLVFHAGRIAQYLMRRRT